MSIVVSEGPLSLSRDTKQKPRIIALVDLENILFSLPVSHPEENFTLESAFINFVSWLKKIGEIKSVFVFGSEKSIFSGRANFYNLGWFPVLSPKVKEWVLEKKQWLGMESKERDTSDESIKKLWAWLNDICDSWDLLCIASGDIDFVPLAKEALRRGKKIAVAAAKKTGEGSEGPLSKELERTASIDEATRTPMVYYFYHQESPK